MWMNIFRGVVEDGKLITEEPVWAALDSSNDIFMGEEIIDNRIYFTSTNKNDVEEWIKMMQLDVQEYIGNI